MQLINECKEVISGAIIGKYYYQDMTLSVLTADDKSRIEAVDNDINGFEEDVQSLLSVRIFIKMCYFYFFRMKHRFLSFNSEDQIMPNVEAPLLTPLLF